MNNKTIASTLLLILLGTPLAACDNTEESVSVEQPRRPVRTLVIDAERESSLREFSGSVDAERKLDLAFRVSGTLQQVNVLVGQEVTEGELLAALDTSEIEIRVRSREADFQRAEADLERGQILITDGVISTADFERLQHAFTLAETELERARLELDYAQLRAPFDGIITARNADNYAEVSARSPVFSLVDLNSLVVRIQLPESVMINVQREGDRPPMFTVFEGQENTPYPVELREVSAQADDATQTYSVTLSLPAVTGINVLPGMSATVTVRSPDRLASATHIPAQAVLEDDAGRYVFVATGDRDNASVERRQVITGQVSSAGLEILSGLVSGDRVITAGMSQLVDGMAVRLD